jgi:hypothetical protein
MIEPVTAGANGRDHGREDASLAGREWQGQARVGEPFAARKLLRVGNRDSTFEK